ncbi:4-hydroxybenzoate octaprenyltransferase [Acetobacteraceae bacterium KSS8]|uniref:4-hydroxybenzoate octaprenyltransferase n=1 Tax=Endosaccharibacter trunci TaxID=2812733 RepID=A0ABT1WAP0_9PROT|nr:4-hydroxybenzoate octaprenyltransferase [Acetobacteraceae bacterium KSS8]
MAHTDIRATGWIRVLPPALRPYALLARLDRPIGTWLLFLPGLWGILLPGGVAPWERVRLIALFAIGSLVMRSAGCVVNDMWDRDLDRQVERTRGRPLASGALRMRHAAAFLILLLAAGLAVLLALDPLCWALGVGSLVLVGLYPLAKRVTWWPQLVMGFTFGFGAPMGYAAATGRIDATALLLYAAAILWDLGFDTVYGFQDMEDDALIGVKSTSRMVAAYPRRFVAACYALTLVALLGAGALARLGMAFFVVLILPAFLLSWQVRSLDIGSPARCLALFRSNREVGLAVSLAILAGRVAL